jgi:hypothetical protein
MATFLCTCQRHRRRFQVPGGPMEFSGGNSVMVSKSVNALRTRPIPGTSEAVEGISIVLYLQLIERFVKDH